jgi:hypothetical protein
LVTRWSVGWNVPALGVARGRSAAFVGATRWSARNGDENNRQGARPVGVEQRPGVRDDVGNRVCQIHSDDALLQVDDEQSGEGIDFRDRHEVP